MRTLLLTTLLAVYGAHGQRQEFCALPSKQGKCRGFFVRFYFDPSTNDCTGFIFGGCNGNRNNFATTVECLEACKVNESSASGSSQSLPETTFPDINNNSSEDTLTESNTTLSPKIAAPASINTAILEGTANVTSDRNSSEAVVHGNVTNSVNESISDNEVVKPGSEPVTDKDVDNKGNTYTDKDNSTTGFKPDDEFLAPRNATGDNGTDNGNSTDKSESTSTLEKDAALILMNNDTLQEDVKNQTDTSKNNTTFVSEIAEVGNVTTNEGSNITSDTTGMQLPNSSSTINSETVQFESDNSTKNSTSDRDDSKPSDEETHPELSLSQGDSSNKDTTTQSSSILSKENEVIPQPLSALASKPEAGDPDCTSDPERGFCRGYFLHYFFNSTVAACEVFIYGGCAGNNNNYDSIRSCQAACVESSNEPAVENEADNGAATEHEAAVENEGTTDNESAAETEAENEAAVPTTRSSLLLTIITPPE